MLISGASLSSCTVTDKVLVHPLEALADSVYKPGVLVDGFGVLALKLAGPVQCHVTLVLALADNDTVGLKQLITAPNPLIMGAIVSACTWTVALAVQPLVAVTVNWYWPKILTTGFGKLEVNVPGPDQV